MFFEAAVHEGDFEEMTKFTPIQYYVTLSRQVVAVATTRVEGAWSAYIGAVHGECHADEWRQVLNHGDKLGEEIAKAIFPQFAKEGPYAP